MKKLLFISILALIMFSCEKKEQQVWGDLLIITDEFGEVFFPELSPGWYYFEAEKVRSSLFAVYAMDSIQVMGTQQVNKILIMAPAD
jgi:hypothetical protein